MRMRRSNKRKKKADDRPSLTSLLAPGSALGTWALTNFKAGCGFPLLHRTRILFYHLVWPLKVSSLPGSQELWGIVMWPPVGSERANPLEPTSGDRKANITFYDYGPWFMWLNKCRNGCVNKPLISWCFGILIQKQKERNNLGSGSF